MGAWFTPASPAVMVTISASVYSPSFTVSCTTYGPGASATRLGAGASGSLKNPADAAGRLTKAHENDNGSPLGSELADPSSWTALPASENRSGPASATGGMFAPLPTCTETVSVSHDSDGSHTVSPMINRPSTSGEKSVTSDSANPSPALR